MYYQRVAIEIEHCMLLGVGEKKMVVLCIASLVPRLTALFAHRRKDPTNIGGFKPLTSNGSDRMPPIRLQNEIMWTHDSLNA